MKVRVLVVIVLLVGFSVFWSHWNLSIQACRCVRESFADGWVESWGRPQAPSEPVARAVESLLLLLGYSATEVRGAAPYTPCKTFQFPPGTS